MASNIKAVKASLTDHSKALDSITDDMESLIESQMGDTIEVLAEEGFFGTTSDRLRSKFDELKKVFKVDKENLRTAADNMRTTEQNNRAIDAE